MRFRSCVDLVVIATYLYLGPEGGTVLLRVHLGITVVPIFLLSYLEFGVALQLIPRETLDTRYWTTVDGQAPEDPKEPATLNRLGPTSSRPIQGCALQPRHTKLFGERQREPWTGTP